MIAKYAFILGTLPFMLLGTIHIIYTLIDVRTPKRLTPFDDAVRMAMQRSTPVLTKETTMWRAWLGFNISHGIGVLFFGLIYFMLALQDFTLVSGNWSLRLLAVAVSASYVVLAVKYWFHIPVIGAGIGCASFLVSLILV